jgi:hypothetical protein
MASTSEELTSQADQLINTVGFFKTDLVRGMTSRTVKRQAIGLSRPQSFVSSEPAAAVVCNTAPARAAERTDASQSLNCWEYMKCGRQPGGEKTREFGVCVAAVDTTHEGVNGGRHAGRYCWKVSGTLCGGKVQGTYAQKVTNCVKCEFYKLVRSEEGDRLVS